MVRIPLAHTTDILGLQLVTRCAPCFAGRQVLAQCVDSSDEEGAHQPGYGAQAVGVSSNSKSVATQTHDSTMELLCQFAERSSLTVVQLPPIRDQFFAHILSCIRMPRGGVNGGGSMHCSFEFVAANEAVVQYLMEDLPLEANRRYNLSLPPPHWESSPSINTYHALDSPLIDSYLRLHRRRAARGYRAYRGSLLATPPDTYPSPVNLLSVAPPFVVELCHRKHSKLVLAVSFNLIVMNDQGLLTLPPVFQYVTGMDAVQKLRLMNHLKKMLARGGDMSLAFKQLVTPFVSSLPESEGEWVAPPSDLSALGLPDARRLSDQGSESDPEGMAEQRASMLAVADASRHRAVGTRWHDRMRRR